MPPAGATGAANNQQLQAMLELERRGELPDSLQPQLQAYRAQGLAPAAPTAIEDNNLENATNVVTAAKAAKDSVGFGTTGLSGALMSHIPGSSAAGLRGYIDTLKSNLAFSELAKMRAQSPTGGALGQVSEGEERLLSSTVASLDPSLPDDQLKAGFDKVIGHYGRWLKTLGYSDDKIASVLKGVNPVAAPGDTKASTDTAVDPNAPVTGKTVIAPILEAGSSNLIGTPSTGPVPTIDISGQDAQVQTPEFRAGLAKLLADPNATADQIRAYWSANAKGAAPATPAAAASAAPLAVDRGKNGLTDRLDAVIRGAADIPSLGFADEIAAGARTVFGNKTMAENLAEERGVDAYDSENHPVYRIAGQLAGGAVLPMGEAATPAELARTGGLYGAGYGFGSTNGSLQDRFLGAGIGGVTGAAGGYGLGKLSELYQGRTPPSPGGPPTTGNAVADAAARRNIPIIAADVAPGARGATSFLDSMPFAGAPVRRRMQAGNDAIESQVGDIAPGATPDRIDTGEAVQGVAQQWVPRSAGVGKALYDRISIPNRSRATSDATRSALEDLTQGLESNPELSKIWVDNPRLKATLDALTSKDTLVDRPIVGGGNAQPLSAIQGGEISWGDLKRLRSIVGEIAGSPSLGSDGNQVAAMKKLYGALSTDMENTALKNGPAAYRGFQRANDFWRQRETRIDDVLSKVIGSDPSRPISGEAVMSQIERWSQNKTGSGVRLENLFSSLGRPGSDARQQVASSVAGALGRATPDGDFSPALLFKQVDRMSNRARLTLFGRQGADALSDLATIAQARAGTMAKLNNSGSGRVSNYLQTIRGLMGLGGGAGLGAASGVGAPAGAILTAGALAIGNISARILTNPAVARALAQGMRATTVEAAQNTITRLGNIATSNPAIRTEVLGIQRRLAQAVNDNLPLAGRAAASPDEGPGNEQ